MTELVYLGVAILIGVMAHKKWKGRKGAGWAYLTILVLLISGRTLHAIAPIGDPDGAARVLTYFALAGSMLFTVIGLKVAAWPDRRNSRSTGPVDEASTAHPRRIRRRSVR
ncbi:hypothetical protein LP7551_02068 [Roseibium album]|nr:hypothetical protein LP7551_02068 [Roseibium album]